jgi:hypothetical protein
MYECHIGNNLVKYKVEFYANDPCAMVNIASIKKKEVGYELLEYSFHVFPLTCIFAQFKTLLTFYAFITCSQ